VSRIILTAPVLQRMRLLPGDAVLCNAIVDPYGKPGVWRVKVWGQPPYDETLFYNIKAAIEDDAAKAGIRWFVETQKQRREDRLRAH
jgi:hypothetical protein